MIYARRDNFGRRLADLRHGVAGDIQQHVPGEDIGMRILRGVPPIDERQTVARKAGIGDIARGDQCHALRRVRRVPPRGVMPLPIFSQTSPSRR